MAGQLSRPGPGAPLEPWLVYKVSRAAAPAVRDRLLAAGSLVTALVEWLMRDDLLANERDRMAAPARERVGALVFAAIDAGSRSVDSGWQRGGMAADYACWLIDGDGAAWRAGNSAAALLVDGLAGMHRLWEPQFSELGDDHALKHPVWPLVAAWLNALRPALEANDREHAVLTLDIRDMHDRGDDAHDLLPDFGGGGPGPVPEAEGAYLRGLPQLPPLERSRVRIPAALTLYDRTGREAATKGRGAPVALRLFHYALLATPTEGRDGEAHVIPFEAEDLTAMMHKAGSYREGRHWEPIRAELERLRALCVQLPPEEGQSVGDFWWPVLVRRMPGDHRGRGEFDVRFPVSPTGAPLTGFMVHRPTLWEQGRLSAPAYRATLGLWALWDHPRTNPPGRPMIAPWWPVVLRDPAGYVVDAGGQVLTYHGKPVRSPFDARAVMVAGPDGEPLWERNRAANLYPVLSRADLVALCYPRGAVGAFRALLHLSRKALQELEADGVCVIERDVTDRKTGAKGWRIMPPYWYVELKGTLGAARRRLAS